MEEISCGSQAGKGKLSLVYLVAYRCKGTDPGTGSNLRIRRLTLGALRKLKTLTYMQQHAQLERNYVDFLGLFS